MKSMMKKWWLPLLGAVIFLALSATGSAMAGYPARPIKVIVTYPVGGGVDIFARAIGEYSEKYFGQKLVIINKGGAGGEIGWNAFVKSRPDGYTLTATVLPNIIYQPRLRAEGVSGYQTEDFIHIGTLVRLPSGVFVRKDSKFQTWKDVVDEARKKPGTVTVGVTGAKNITHGLFLQLEKADAIKLKLVTYTGGAPLLKDTIGGHVEVMLANAMFIIQGKDTLRCLGLADDERHALGPEMPTLREQGTNVVDFLTRGLAVPKGTPPEVVAHLVKGLKQMAQDKKFQEKMRNLGLPVRYFDGEQTQKMVREIIADKGWLFAEFKK